MYVLTRVVIISVTFIAIVSFGLFTLYAALRFAIWWPTVFGLDGTLRSALAFFTALPLVVWLRAFEWANFYNCAVNLMHRALTYTQQS